MKISFSTKCALLVILIVSIVGISIPALASKDVPPIFFSLSNDYVRFDWGVGSTVDFKIGSVQFKWDVAGRFAIRSVGGDPETNADDGVDLTPTGHDWEVDGNGKIIYDHGWAPCNKFGYVKVKVGEGVPSLIGISGGSWTQPLRLYSPPNGLGLGKNGRYIEGEWTTTENVAILMTIYLVRDQVRWQFDIKNKSANSLNVGIQMQGAVYNTLQGSGFQQGPVFVSGFGHLEYGKVFSGTSIPDTIEKMDSITTPTIVGRHTLASQDATAPHRVALGEQDRIVGVTTTTDSKFTDGEIEMWLEPHVGYPNGSFTPDPRIGEDNMGWGICWDRRAIASGSSRKIVTFYGIGVADSVWTMKNDNVYDFDSAALAIQSIRALQYDTTDPARTSDITPETFTVKAYIDNLATDKGVYDLSDVDVSLMLPDGLKLVSGKSVQSLGYITSDVEVGPATWTIMADGTVSGALKYFVKAQDSVSGWNQIVSRTVLVPATGIGTLRAGWQLVSVPFKFADSSPNYVFGKLTGEIFPQYWNLSGSGSGSYKPLLAVTPGQAFWAYATGGGIGEFTLASDKRIFGELDNKQGASISIDLKPGWNLVGNPFLYPVYWGQVQFYNKNLNQALPMQKAVSAGWINSTFFTWNAPKEKYDYFSNTLALLEPYKGYWVRAKKFVTMIITPLQWPLSDVTVPAGG